MDFIFQILVLIMSVVIHEVSHGYAARALGDPTAEYEGRLTLNPLKHLDPFGSVLLPLLTYFSGGFILGWAKPVPYNPYNLRPGRFSEALVALAGPASNLSIALIFGLILRTVSAASLNAPFFQFIIIIVLVNIVLAVFNLVPVPPLDGSKVLFALLPERAAAIRGVLERYGFFILIIFIFFLWQLILPLVSLIFSLITGLSF
jgi:Zn-dependent protease